MGEVLSGQQIDMGTGVVLAVDFSDVQEGETGVGGDTTHLTWGPNNIDPKCARAKSKSA